MSSVFSSSTFTRSDLSGTLSIDILISHSCTCCFMLISKCWQANQLWGTLLTAYLLKGEVHPSHYLLTRMTMEGRATHPPPKK